MLTMNSKCQVLVANVVILICGLFTVGAKIPPGYVMQVKPNCGNDSVEDASVHIVTDLRVAALGVCKNNLEVPFTNVDGVNLYLNVSYPNQGGHNCIFEKRKDSQVYVIKVYISWGELDKHVHQEQEEFFVTCTFDEHGKEFTRKQEVEDSLVAPIAIQTHLGSQAVSTFTLTMTNVLGESLAEESVPLGKIICLHASSDGASGEQGIRPVGCDAIGSLTGRRYAILRAGCGDGVVFNKSEGFITKGREAFSPYFSAFDMAGEPSIQFECNFTLCNTSCDGSSCSIQRRKRSGSGDVHKQIYTLHLDDPEGLEDPDVRSSYPVSDSPHDLIFWTALLAISALSLLSVCMSVCLYARRERTCSVVQT